MRLVSFIGWWLNDSGLSCARRVVCNGGSTPPTGANLLYKRKYKMKQLTDEQIKDMVSDIINSVDYDIWKDIFSDEPEDPEWTQDLIDELICVVKNHIE